MLPLLLALLTPPAQGEPTLALKGGVASVDGLDLCFGTGLRIAYMVDHTHPTVTVTTVVGSGAIADPTGKEGLAHVVEHLWFRSGPEDYPTVDVAHSTIGAWGNASTTLDDTVYETVGPATELDAIVSLEVARLMNPLRGVTEEILNTEREVVRNELRQRIENSSAVGLAELRQLVFPDGNPNKRFIGGTHESLDAITLSDVEQFVAKHYTPGNTTWVVTGPWSRNTFAKKLAPNLPTQVIEDPANPDAPPGAATCANRSPKSEDFDFDPPREATVVEGGVTQPIGLFGWALPSGYSDIYVQSQRAMWSMESALDNYGASCNISAGRTSSLGYCSLPLGHVRTAEREAYLRDALDQINYLWDRDYQSYQNRVFREEVGNQLAWLYRSVETETAYQPGARDLHHTGRFDTLVQYMNQIAATNQDRDTLFLEKWLNQRRAATVLITPRTDSDSAGSNRHAETLTAPGAAVDGDLDDETIRDTVHLPDLEELKTVTLSNGLEVWILPLEGPPFAHVSLLLEGNIANAPSVAVDILRDRNHSDLDTMVGDNEWLSQAPELIGGNWYTDYTSTTKTIGIRGAAANLDGLLYLLRKRIDRSRVSLESRRIQYMNLDEQKWIDRDYVETWENELYDAHLGRITSTLDEDLIAEIKKVGGPEASAWNKKIVNPTNAVLLVVGDIDAAKADKLVRMEFADWRDRSDGAELTVKAPEPAHQPTRIVLLNDPGRTNAKVHAACTLAQSGGDGAEVRRVLASGLESSLWADLRDRQGATYGVSAWTSAQANDFGALHLDSDLQSDAAPAAVKAFLGGIEALGAGEGVTEDHVQSWKLSMARDSILSQRTYSDIRGWLEWSYESGKALEGLAAYPERLAAVDLDAIQAELSPCAGNELVTVVGPIDKLRSGFDAAGMDYEVVDWESERDRLMSELDPKRYKRELRERKKR